MSEDMKKYMEHIEAEIERNYKLATKAREKGYDPEKRVDIPIARNMAERVEGIISAVAPELVGTTMTDRILELEKEYGAGAWEVALLIAKEVAQEKFYAFGDKIKAMEIGIRTGMAYSTAGIVAAPLEGFIELRTKKRADGKEYFSVFYAGPIRGAGGTAASVSVIIADYVRKQMGYAPFDPTEKEIKRYLAEIRDYHERITNLQYFPSDEELEFLIKNVPVEVNGDPTEKLEVSNYKDLPRIETNRIRGGMCLVMAEGLSQKAPKLWKRLQKWGNDFELDWDFLQEFLDLQKRIKAGKKKDVDTAEKKAKLEPNFTYIKDLVAGRPVLTHPMAHGGFRLRMGRTRTSGFSAACLHPATQIALDGYIATGTQLKVERPGKATAITVCDTIEGPIVKLKNGTVLHLSTTELAKQHHKEIDKILFLGDILFNYGDFFENGHSLVPVGYCEEWWLRDLEKAVKEKHGSLEAQSIAQATSLPLEKVQEILAKPTSIQLSDAFTISKTYTIPLHPQFTYHWAALDVSSFETLMDWLYTGKLQKDASGVIEKIIVPETPEKKELLERIGMPHEKSTEHVVIKQDEAHILTTLFGLANQQNFEALQNKIQSSKTQSEQENQPTVLNIINAVSPIQVRDKSGTFVGARMGRPEKSKMRKLTGSPHLLFPVGDQGGRLRSFQATLDEKKITSMFPLHKCAACDKETVYKVCQDCESETQQLYVCRSCGPKEKDNCPAHGPCSPYSHREVKIRPLFEAALKKLGMRIYPDLIKGVRGTSNKDHIPENLAKGILRARHDVYVNKDGTTRYDMSELPLTHFKASELETPVERLIELGYTKDIHGKPLQSPDQVLELKPQDLILPAGSDSMEVPGHKVLFNVANFVDELLQKFYGLESFYNLEKPQDIVGHLVIGLAPHISAGIVGRIIGFSKVQGMYAHPLYHAAMRRDCFTGDTFIPLYYDGSWHIQEIKEVVDSFNPADIIDDFGTKEATVKGIQTIGENLNLVTVNNFTKHTPQQIIEVKTKLGRVLKTTHNHKNIIIEGKKEKIVRSHELKVGDILPIPYSFSIPKKDVKKLDLLHELSSEDWVMVRGVNNVFPEVKKYAKKAFTKREYDNFTRRDSYPISFIASLKNKKIITSTKGFFLAAKRDTVKIPAEIEVTKEFLQIIGLYIAEGYSRKVPGMLYQVYIAAEKEEIRAFIQKNIELLFGLKPSEKKQDRVTYSSRIVYHLFTQILKCGSSAYEKRFPARFLNLPNEKLGYILSGYFEGDGSVSETDLRVIFDTVSQGLLRDLDFVFGQMGIFVKNYTYTSLPGKKLRDFYYKKREIPKFTITKGIIQSVFVKNFSKYVNFISSRKKRIFEHLLKNKKATYINQKYNKYFVFDEIESIKMLPAVESYCLSVQGHKLMANSILSKQCDGDEACVMLLMDALLNFSRQFLPDSRGSRTMDSPLVLTVRLVPSEVDDMVLGLDTAWQYNQEFYQACLEYKKPWDVDVEQLRVKLDTDGQYEGFGFTHTITDINDCIRVSSYKTLPSMQEKLGGQMELAEKIMAVDEADVATRVIEKHFIRDTRGNLRKFSKQQFRCVKCNDKFRRPPLLGKCTSCKGKIIFTISEGSVIKYLEPSLSLARKYDVPSYLKQTLDLTKQRIEEVFGRDKEKQTGLGAWFG